MGRKPKPDPTKNDAFNYVNKSLLPIDRGIWIFAIIMGRFSSHQACRFFNDKASRATVERRLKMLHDDGILLRYRPPRDRCEGTYPFVYQVSPYAVKIMRKANWATDLRKQLHKLPTGNTTHLTHRLAVNDAVIEFIRAECSDKPLYNVVQPLIRARVAQSAAERVHINTLEGYEAKYLMLQPDARLNVLLDIKEETYDVVIGDYRSVVTKEVPIYLEVDRGTEKLKQIRRQINYYLGAYLTDQWYFEKHEFPLVCWIFEKAGRAEEVRKHMEYTMENPFDIEVMTTRHGREEIESDFRFEFFTTCITTKEMFYRAGSIAKDEIWYINHHPGRFSLEQIATARCEAIREVEKEEAARERRLKRKRETVKA